MKDVRQIEISYSSSAAEIYNGLRQKSPTTFFEARRTLEALSRVQGHKILLEKIKEVADDESGNRKTNTRSNTG